MASNDYIDAFIDVADLQSDIKNLISDSTSSNTVLIKTYPRTSFRIFMMPYIDLYVLEFRRYQNPNDYITKSYAFPKEEYVFKVVPVLTNLPIMKVLPLLISNNLSSCQNLEMRNFDGAELLQDCSVTELNSQELATEVFDYHVADWSVFPQGFYFPKKFKLSLGLRNQESSESLASEISNKEFYFLVQGAQSLNDAQTGSYSQYQNIMTDIENKIKAGHIKSVKDKTELAVIRNILNQIDKGLILH